MSRQEATNQYLTALKAGQKNYRDCVLQGRYPYPQVLDEILDDSMAAGQVDLGLIGIPTERIVGTKAAGRISAFAANFMPLLPSNTEFAGKWIELCLAHLGEGIRDPVRCYEYMGRFYIQEGNKRVSVLKSYGAPTLTRLSPGSFRPTPRIRRCRSITSFCAPIRSPAYTRFPSANWRLCQAPGRFGL